MGAQADWGAVPRAVVGKVLWSDHLQLLHRLRCQEVCQTWKSLLRERPSAVEHSILSTQLRIIVCCSSTRRQEVVLNLDSKPAAMLVVAAPSHQVALIPFHDTFPECYQWLTLQARLLCGVKLSGVADTWWLMRDIVRVLQVASPQTPPAIDFSTSVGTVTA